MCIVFSEKCDFLCNELVGVPFPSDYYIIADGQRLEEAIRTLPFTNRKAREFAKYVLQNMERIEYSQNEIEIPISKDELKVARAKFDIGNIEVLYVYSKGNEVVERRFEYLPHQILDAKIEKN